MLQNPQSKITQVASILAQSFIDDPSFDFVFGENANKFKALNAFFELFVADAMERGKIIIAPEEQGACIWYPAEVPIFNEQFEQTLIEIISVVSHSCGSESGKRFEHLVQQVGDKEPKQTHCEVFFLGLKPEARGKGIGGTLLNPVLNYADTKQVACYLVSSNQRNVSFYERQGFKKYCPIEISDSYSMTGMWRDFANV
ncbi:MAG: GNAT family N-acetyltransferase [Scytonematopsis contorta HA4267-MV1]|jgi:ribosomal protein S18 acetylase RimI-like enzyme|nr:GNAT family N-acetyltransferase [Scytonematopsis contorta HA4267-MV1]